MNVIHVCEGFINCNKYVSRAQFALMYNLLVMHVIQYATLRVTDAR